MLSRVLEPEYGLQFAAQVDPSKLARVLLYGRAATRRDIAEGLLRTQDGATVRLLADTARGPGAWLLRARSLEVLGAIAGNAEQHFAAQVLDALFASERLGALTSSSPAVLSAREHAIATHVARGLSNADVAARLGISRRTVENHVSRILAKLGLTSRTQLAIHLSTGAQRED
jgi:DNA-binding NarL/FixJ family response regulator